MNYAEIKRRVRQLRREATPPEKVLWAHLRDRRLDGMKFVRQHPIIYQSVQEEHFFFVPDFYCSESRLAVELDGPVHDLQREKDYNRDRVLEQMRITVVRVKNEELDTIENVLNKIRDRR